MIMIQLFPVVLLPFIIYAVTILLSRRHPLRVQIPYGIILMVMYLMLYYVRDRWLSHNSVYSLIDAHNAQSSLIAGTSDFLLVAIPFVIVIWVGWKSWSSRAVDSQNLPDLTDQNTLTDYVRGILNSEDFLVALRSSLPKGQTDAVYGLDYIPFMLHTIDERRKRFAKSARLFLAGTVVLGMLFSLVVIYFGYILVNEASVGASRSLAELREETRSISGSLDLIRPSFYGNQAFQRTAGESLSQLELAASSLSNKEMGLDIVKVLDDAKKTGDFKVLLKALETAKTKISSQNVTDQQFIAKLTKAYEDVSRFTSSSDGVLVRLDTELNALTVVMGKAGEVLDKPENRLPELLKRLALGIVVASFFFAILRYVGGLYRSHHQEMLKCEAEDLAVRRFYIAYKSAGSNDDQRQAVISSFITSAAVKGDNGQTDASGLLTKEQFDVFKEALATLAKRL